MELQDRQYWEETYLGKWIERKLHLYALNLVHKVSNRPIPIREDQHQKITCCIWTTCMYHICKPNQKYFDWKEYQSWVRNKKEIFSCCFNLQSFSEIIEATAKSGVVPLVISNIKLF